MGDTYQTIVDLEADTQSAAALVNRVRGWMISQQLIVAQETDCVMLGGLGHAPGVNYILAVGTSYHMPFELRINGVKFIAERSVFYSIGIGGPTLICSVCEKHFGYNDVWSTAIENWYMARGPRMLACEHCGAKSPITEWQHEPPWAFANLGIQFWNWPQLRKEFLNKVSEVLEHRVRLVYGKF